MVTADTVRNVVGIIGNVISFGLFLSPLPTFLQIWKKKAVEDYSPIPYLATLLNCILWCFYGLPIVHPHSILVVTINGIGLVLESVYITTFLFYSTPAGKRKILGILAGEILFVAVVAVGVLLGAHTHEKRSLIVGVLCAFFGTCMYASPLAVMRMVIKTKSVKYMPFSLSFVSFLNGVCWTIYALIGLDIFMTIPNGLGTLFATAQLVLYAHYYSSTPKEETSKEIQMPTAAVAPGNEGGLPSFSTQ